MRVNVIHKRLEICQKSWISQVVVYSNTHYSPQKITPPQYFKNPTVAGLYIIFVSRREKWNGTEPSSAWISSVQKKSFFPDVDFYPCDKQGYCNRVLGFFPVNNYVHRMVNFVAKVNFKTCSISEISSR